MKQALVAAGAGPADIVRMGIFVVDLDEEKLQAVRTTRDEILRFDQHPPTSTLLGVQALALPGLLIEVNAIAVAG